MLNESSLRLDFVRAADGEICRLVHIPTGCSTARLRGSLADEDLIWLLERELLLHIRKTIDPVIDHLPLALLPFPRATRPISISLDQAAQLLSNGSTSLVVAQIGLPLDFYEPPDASRIWDLHLSAQCQNPPHDPGAPAQETTFLAFLWTEDEPFLVSLEKSQPRARPETAYNCG